MSFFDKFKKKAENVAQGVYRQVNPLDGGKTYSNRIGAQAPQQVQQKIQGAKFGVLANNPSAQRALIGSIKPTQFNQFAAGGNVVKDMGANIIKPFQQTGNMGVYGAKTVNSLIEVAQKQKTSSQAKADLDRYSRGRGTFGAGLPNSFKGVDRGSRGFIQDPEKIRSAIGTGIQAGTTAVPVGRGLSVAKQGTSVIPKLAMQNAPVSALGSAGYQYAETGKVDPRQLVTDTALGTALGIAPPALFAGGKKAVSKATYTPKLNPQQLTARNDLLTKRATAELRKPGIVPYLDEKIAAIDATTKTRLKNPLKPMNQGGYIKNPLADTPQVGKTPKGEIGGSLIGNGADKKLTVIQTPNGRFTLAGSIPEELTVVKKNNLGQEYRDAPVFNTKAEAEVYMNAGKAKTANAPQKTAKTDFGTPTAKDVENSLNPLAVKERGGVARVEPSARGSEYWNIKFNDGSEAMNIKLQKPTTPPVAQVGKTETVYHGTSSKFDRFDPNKLGMNTGAEDAKMGFHFTDNKEVADMFGVPKLTKSANIKAERVLDWNKVSNEDPSTLRNLYEIVTGEKAPKIGSSELDEIIDSFGYDMGFNWRDFKWELNRPENLIRLKERYDAIKLPLTESDMKMAIKGGAKKATGSEYIVFDPNKIESTPAPQVGKTYTVPKTNPTDVTKLSEKDLQHFGKQGYTAITDRYGNTRQITPVKTDGIQKLDNLNPTGGVYVDYTPQTRATMPLADNMTTFDKTSGKAPNEMVTIYRGAPKNQKGIVAGDFITTNKELAKSYTGDGNVLEMKVPASHILDDTTSPLGEEYLYRPTKSTPVAQVGKTPNIDEITTAMAQKTRQASQLASANIDKATGRLNPKVKPEVDKLTKEASDLAEQYRQAKSTPVAQVGKTVQTAPAPTIPRTKVKQAPPAPKAQLATIPPDGTMTKTGGDMARTGGALTKTAPKGKETRYASKTIPESEFVSDKIKGSIKAPEYSVQTEKQGYTSAVSRLKSEGDAKFERNVFDAIDKKNGTISRQEAIDAQTLAAVLDGTDEAGIRKATQIYERLSEHYTAAGQLAQAAAIMARRSPEGLRSYATKTLKANGVEMTPQLQKQLVKLIDGVKTATPEAMPRAQWEVMNLVAKKIPTKTGDKIVNTWRAGLLTAPTTTGGNLLGNSGEALVRKGFVNPVAVAADKAMSLVTGKRSMTLGKAGAGLQGGKEGTGMLKDYLKTGYDPRNNAAKYDAPRSINTGSKALDTYINGTYRMMGVVDMPFSTFAEREALSSIAKSEAINKGLKGQARSNFVKEFMASPPETAIARAQKEADYATFKNPTALGKAATGLKKPLGPVGDFVVPFTQVPASIATRIVERTPIGTATEMIKQIKAVKAGGQFDQRAMSQAIGNGAFAPAIMGVGFALAGDGLLTYGYPTDSKERKLWDSEGKQPYSVRVGDRWYSLNYLQPFGTLLAIGGQARKAKDEGKDYQSIVGQGVATAGQSVMNQSFLKGIGGALDAISDPERSTRKYVEQTTSSLIPNFTRSFARAIDPQQRAPEGIGEGIKSGIPGVRESTTPKLDMFGQPLPAKDTFANQYLNPLKPSKVRGDSTTAELRRLFENDTAVMPSEANKAVFGKDKPLEKKQLDALNQFTGTAMQKAYNATLNSPEYKALSDEDKNKTIKKINDVVYGSEKIAWGVKQGLIEADGKKLTKDQQAYLQGKGVDFLPKNTVAVDKKKPTTKAKSTKTSSAKSRKAKLEAFQPFKRPAKINLKVSQVAYAPVKKAVFKRKKASKSIKKLV